jgi:hypothetical protein
MTTSPAELAARKLAEAVGGVEADPNTCAGGPLAGYADLDLIAAALLDAGLREAVEALQGIIDAVWVNVDGGAILKDDRSTWNKDAHVELTVTMADLWAVQDALARLCGDAK